MKKTIECVPSNACTGCGACYNKCPVSAIKMEYDSEGFIFPTVVSSCIGCGQCTAVCPALHPLEHYGTPESYAVWASDEVRLKSSSGGMFSIIANYVLKNGGAVCGAAYTEDYMYVHHIWAESAEELAPLRGSKYVQSDTELTFKQAKKYLDSGRMVLYTGCACQIAGLYNFLGEEYDKLYTADLVCHGSNSVTAYQSFIKEFSGGKEIEKVDFRDKVYFPWSTPQVVYLKNGDVKKATWNEGAWYKGFLEGIINRNNCYKCPYAKAERIADITMADCWQVHRIDPKFDDRKGTSLVLVNSPKGKKLFEKLKGDMKLCEKIPLSEARKYNGQLNWPTPPHPSRKYFFSHLDQGYHKALWYGRGLRFDVGIVGWWFASNYGSALTYYALGNLLSDIGKQPILVKLPTKSGNAWDPDTKISIDFLRKYFKTTNDRDFHRLFEVNHFCDAFMLGSDQMWRVDSLKTVGYAFFLDFVDKNKKKIAFSTSFGNEHFSDNKEITETAGDFLKRFDAISVREKSGIEVCRREFGVDAQQVLDPVFLCKKEVYEKAIQNIYDRVPKKYLLCYILDPSPEKEAAAKAIAEKEDLEIITILGMKEYAKAVENWNAGTVLPKISPEQFLYYIKNCSYLMTDSHHGTCFGIIFEKPYVAIVNANRGATRFETVAEVTGLTGRLFYNALDICASKKPFEPIDYSEVKKKLQPEILRGIDWLKNALACPTKQNEDTVRTLKVEKERLTIGMTNKIKWLQDKNAQLSKELEELKNK